MAWNWVWFALLAATTVVSYLTRPRPEQPRAATREEFDVPNSEEGVELPVVFGTVLLSQPSVVKDGDFRTTAVKQKSGKK